MTDSPDHQITLADGRRLGYAHFGTAHGPPIIYFHGFPASRLEARLIQPAALRHKVRVIAVDRPGYGLSEFQPDRKMTDWPDDVVQLADALGLERFALLGVSGGGPYALVCAWKIPQRINGAAVVAGLGPVYEAWAVREMSVAARLGFFLARRSAWLLHAIYGGMTAKIMQRHPELVLGLLIRSSPSTDSIVLRRTEIREAIHAAIRDALRSGPSGPLWDMILYSRRWGFRLEDIEVPIDVWQGEADATVPASHARYLAGTLPHVRLRLLPHEGHFSLPVNYMDEILRALTEVQRSQSAKPC